MGRRFGFEWTLPVALVAAGCGSGSAASGPPPAGLQHASLAAARKPNILLVLTDDLDAASVEFMPKTKALIAARGATFLNSFSSTPLCCPSRASLLTGQYAHNHGVFSNGSVVWSCFEDFRDSGRERQALPLWLKAAGYRTGLIGKYLNRYPGSDPSSDESYIPPGWDEWHATFEDRLADCPSCLYYNYFVNDNGSITSYGDSEADYVTDVLSEKAVAFVKASAGGAGPFFLVLAPSAPHAPALPAPRQLGAYADQYAPRGPSFNEEDVSDKPSWLQEFPLLRQEDIDELDSQQRNRLESLLAVDDTVEKIVLTLQAVGELDNTYIFLTSDNGFLSGQHRFTGGKAAVYEESIRVPLMVRGPGISPGLALRQAVLNIDLAPTFAELAQAVVPDFVDGRSLAPLFSGGSAGASWRKDLLVEYQADRATGMPTWAALRTDRDIYVEYPALSEREYYDLVEDPFQLDSRHGSLDPARLSALSARLGQLQDCRGAACRN